MKTRFIFFDLGNVLLRFSTARLARQGAAVSGCGEFEVRQAVYGNGMQRKIECGEISEADFYEAYCSRTGTRPEPEKLLAALNDIFEVLEETQPFVRRLVEIDFPRGVLSNVGISHWRHCTETYPFLLECFPKNHVLSYEVGAMKPETKIFESAFETARSAVPDIMPGEIFFLDDMEPNVVGARQFGLDAIQFISPEQIALEIDRRGLGPFRFM